MSQDENKKLDYIKRKNDVDFALKHPEYFDDLPSATDLLAESEVYTQLINAVMAHQVRLAKGQIQTPETFDPATVHLTEPAPRQFTRKATAQSPSQHPSSITVPDVLEEDASLAQATLQALGLQCIVTIQAVPGLLPHFVGSQDPPAGSTVPAGTTVTLVVAP
jgi:hypothetical protein